MQLAGYPSVYLRLAIGFEWFSPAINKRTDSRKFPRRHRQSFASSRILVRADNASC